MFKQPIARFVMAGLAGLAGLGATDGRAHAGPGDFNFSGRACSPLPGYQVDYDSLGVHSVGSSGAWVLCADANQRRRYKGFSVSITDRSTAESVICSFSGKNGDKQTFGPQTQFSGAAFTGGPFLLLAGIFPNVVSSVMLVQCWLPAPNSEGASYVHNVAVDVY
jgi:hypothetical protein